MNRSRIGRNRGVAAPRGVAVALLWRSKMATTPVLLDQEPLLDEGTLEPLSQNFAVDQLACRIVGGGAGAPPTHLGKHLSERRRLASDAVEDDLAVRHRAVRLRRPHVSRSELGYGAIALWRRPVP